MILKTFVVFTCLVCLAILSMIPISLQSANNNVHYFLHQPYINGYFNESSIQRLSTAICREEAYVIRVIIDGANETMTAQHILQSLNTYCRTTPFEVMYGSVYRQRSETNNNRFELSIFVFILENAADASTLVYRNLEAKARLRYFVIIDGLVKDSSDSTRSWLHTLFVEFWKKQVLNVVVIFNAGQGLEWFTYTPFTDRTEIVNPVKLHFNDEFFYNKLSNVNQSIFVVSMYRDDVRAVPRDNFETNGFSGVDGMVADLIRERMNATFLYRFPKYIFNGSVTTGALGELHANRANFGFNAETYVRAFYERTVEASNSFERHDICVIVPNSAMESTLYNLLHTLTPLTWSIVISSIVLMVTAYKWLQFAQRRFVRSNTERRNYTWFGATSIHFQSFFGDSITSLPTSVSMRILIFCWCVYSFLITTAFTAKLISSLVRPRHLDDIDTIEELSRSELNIIYPAYLNNTLWQYLDDDVSLFALLRDKMRPVPTERFHAMIKEDRLSNAYAMRNYMAKYLKQANVDAKSGRSYYHVMQECLMYSPKVYLVEQGSAYLGHINDLIGRFNEMGFVVKWERDTLHRNTLDGKIEMSNGEEEENESAVDDEELKVVITVSHLQTAFYLLSIGLFTALIGLYLELWWDRKERLKSRYRVYYFDNILAKNHGCIVD